MYIQKQLSNGYLYNVENNRIEIKGNVMQYKQRREKMADPRAFISFDVDHNSDEKILF